MTTKSEFYTKAINIYKETGQGLSGIVFVMGAEAGIFRTYMNEFIEEGLMVCCEDGTSIGHPESSKWYMPTTGYNVWMDEEPGERYKGSNLQLIRYYLGALELDLEPSGERENLAKYLNPSAQDLTQRPGFITRYSEWLTKNHEALEVMKNLSNIYFGASLEIDETGKDYIKNLKIYVNNPTVSEIISDLNSDLNIDHKIKDTTIRMVELMKNAGKSKESIDESESEIERYSKEIETIQRAVRFLQEKDPEDKIQNVIQ
jgi:hypothetical protein